MPHAIYITFLFALGACIGSFLNVVVWRLPRGESLSHPPSHCPKCNNRLKWFDNIPVLGWIKLGGKCRFCKLPISMRYPIIEAFTGGLFVFYYVMFFIVGFGPSAHPGQPPLVHGPLDFSTGWPMYALYMLLLCVLLAASLIDAESFFIPISMIWYVAAPVALVWHAIMDTPRLPGNLNASPLIGAMGAGGGIGLLISFILWRVGILPTSFADGGPPLEIDRAAHEEQLKQPAGSKDKSLSYEEADVGPALKEYTAREIRAEIRKEMLFLLPPIGLAILATVVLAGVPSVWQSWTSIVESNHWFSGLLGSIYGLLIGGFVVWMTRILGTLGFGREAMGMGDVHLMAGVGAVIGAGGSTVAFFLAPFFGIVLAVYMLLTGTKRELPYGPYLSMATALVMLIYSDVAGWLAPGMEGLSFFVGRWFGH